MSFEVGMCYCNDGCLAAAVVFREPEGLAGRQLSCVFGMGSGEYAVDLVPGHFEEVVCYSSFRDVAWMLLRRGAAVWRVKLSTGPAIQAIIMVELPFISGADDGAGWEQTAIKDVDVQLFQRTHHRALQDVR